MGSLQFVEHRQEDGTVAIEARPNPDDLAFLDFESTGTTALLWGTEDLVDIAVGLRAEKFMAIDLTVSDSQFNLLPDDEAKSIKQELLHRINSEGRAATLSFLSVDLVDCLVLAITVRKKGDGVFRIIQNGQVEITGPSNEADFLRLLKKVIIAT
jgi:hypothetical protein